MSLRRTCKTGDCSLNTVSYVRPNMSPFPVERCHFLAKRWIFLAGTSSFSCGKLVRMRSITNQYGGLVNQNGEYRLEILDGIREWQMSTAKISGLQHHPVNSKEPQWSYFNRQTETRPRIMEVSHDINPKNKGNTQRHTYIYIYIYIIYILYIHKHT